MEMKFEQTKGYVFLVGTIAGIDNKEPRRTEYKNELNIRIRTDKDNSVFAKVGGWNNSSLSVKFKPQGMEQADEIPVGEAPDVLQDYFKDGDSVLVRGSIDVNTYKEGRLDIVVNGIYACSEEINFDSETFEERNEVKIPGIVAGEFDGEKIPVMFANYKGETMTQSLKVENEVIKEFLAGVNIGDLIPFTLSVVNRPIYEVVAEESKETTARKTLLGKTIGGSNKTKRKIVDNEKAIIIQDIDVEKIVERKYDIKNDIPDMPF